MALTVKHWEKSAIVAPLVGGALLDHQRNGLVLWLIMSAGCLAMLPALSGLHPRYKTDETSSAVDLSGDRDQLVNAVTGSPGDLGR